jgi:DNA repair protein RadC
MKQLPHYSGHRKRLRERLCREPALLPDYEVLELLLAYGLPRRDTKQLAKDLLAEFKTMEGVLGARDGALLKVSGFGPGLLAYWKVLREVWARKQASAITPKEQINSPSKVAALASARLGSLGTEEFWVILVDNKNRLLAFERVSRGTVDQTPVYPREVLAMAFTHQASGMMLVHNHPGGDPTPSSQDMELTRRISQVATDVGIRVLDHLVVAESRYFSFQEQGLL